MPEYLKKASIERESDVKSIRRRVEEMLDEILSDGEAAIRRYSKELDNWDPDTFLVSGPEIERAQESIPTSLRDDIEFAAKNITTFARAQLGHIEDFETEVIPGVTLGQRTIPVSSAGSYTPGGRYPLISSALMTVITPKVAGVERVVAVAPSRDGQGIHPPTLAAMAHAGADEIYCLGGVQAMAALAYGALEGLDPVDVLVGAGNAYVAEAKRQLFGHVGVDLIAGPTEILILADESADPEFVANDLLGQAEHDPRAPAILVTTSRQLGDEVKNRVDVLLDSWPTAEIAGVAWRQRGEILVAEDVQEAIDITNDFAPEHLELLVAVEEDYVEKLVNYGSLFIGEETTVAYGDKAVGTNHVLPTMRAGRYTGGLWVGKFLKTVTTQKLTREGSLAVAGPTSRISNAEMMFGHAITADIRTDRYLASELPAGAR